MLSSFLLFLATIAVLPAAVLLKPCPIDSCPCVRRGTFDSAWLAANLPNLAAQWKDYTFSAPNVTYPNCTSIVATCPTGSIVASLNVSGLISTGDRFPNPYVLPGIWCEDNNWWSVGFNQPLDDNIKSTNVSCAIKV